MLKNEEINSSLKEIRQNYALIYELNRQNDIDCGKSPDNQIKKTEDYWEFICENGAEISINDFEIIFGSLTEKDDCWEGLLQKQQFYKKNLHNDKIFSAVLSLSEQYDILNISFRGTESQSFKMHLYNESLYQVKMYVKDGRFDTEENKSYQKECQLAILQCPPVTFNLEQKNNFAIFIDKHLMECLAYKYSCHDTTSFYYDYNAGKININNQNWRKLYDLELDKLKYFELYSTHHDNAISAADDIFYFYKIRYAKNNGYLYLKPITLVKGIYKVFLQYTGEPVLEYYRQNSSNWELVPEKLRLTAEENLQFRIKMNAGDRLYNFFITSS